MLSKGIRPLVVFGSGLPEHFSIGPESNNYMHRPIYETVVSCSCVYNHVHLPIVCFQQLIVKEALGPHLEATWQAPGRFLRVSMGH